MNRDALISSIESESKEFLGRVSSLLERSRSADGSKRQSSKNTNPLKHRIQSSHLAFQVLTKVICKENEAYNDLLPIHHVPIELMVNIFLHIQKNQHWWCGELERLSLVCQRWYKILFDTASLWTVLRASFPRPFNVEVLTKSGSLPLSVFCESDSSQGPSRIETGKRNDEFLSLLLPHIGRWKAVALDFGVSSTISSVLSSSAPLLESIKLIGSRTNNTESTAIPSLFGQPGEHLKHLHLFTFGFPWTSDVFRGLRSLTLAHDRRVLTSMNLVQLLSQSPQLECLVLRSLQIVVGIDAPSVSLPRLDDLQLSGLSRDVISHLLSCINTPGCNSMKICPLVNHGESASSFIEGMKTLLESKTLQHNASDAFVQLTFFSGRIQWCSRWKGLELEVAVSLDIGRSNDCLRPLRDIYKSVLPPKSRVSLEIFSGLGYSAQIRNVLAGFNVVSIYIHWESTFAEALIKWLSEPLEEVGKKGWMFEELESVRFEPYIGSLRLLQNMLKRRYGASLKVPECADKFFTSRWIADIMIDPKQSVDEASHSGQGSIEGSLGPKDVSWNWQFFSILKHGDPLDTAQDGP